MLVDHYFLIGQGHVQTGTPCQDYAISAMLAARSAFAAVADGCSNAGSTHIGARLIVAACQDVLIAEGGRPDVLASADFAEKLRTRFNALHTTDNLEDYFATLVALSATPSALRFHVSGDGAFAVVFADGTVEFTTIAWWLNCPYYLALRDDPELDATIRQMFAGLKHGPVREAITRFRYAAGGIEIISEQERWCPLSEFENGKTYGFDLSTKPVAAAAVMSDGIEQVGYVPMLEVVANLLSFPTEPVAGFARKQLTEAVRRYSARGEYAMDDLAHDRLPSRGRGRRDRHPRRSGA